jgi:thiol:disulfide interchange protein DsbA
MNKKDFGLLAVLNAFLIFASSTVLGQGASSPKYQEGVHYNAIENAPMASGDSVEVAEAFSYMCTHCATFEPYISRWQQHKPENVSFRRIPVVFGRDSWEVYARAYVTAEIMGIADAAHSALMDKIWKEKQVPRSLEELSKFYAAYDADAARFVATSKSFAVDAKMRKDQRAIQTAGVQGTPSLIVNGRYLVASNEAVANFDMMLDVVDYLISLELAAHTAAATTPEAAAEKDVPAAAD